MDYAIHLSAQLREHLRALRKARGLTQTELGQLLGLGQARVAEIESNPGVVSLDQLLRVLQALNTALVLRETTTSTETDPLAAPGTKRPRAARPKTGSW